MGMLGIAGALLALGKAGFECMSSFTRLLLDFLRKRQVCSTLLHPWGPPLPQAEG